MSLTPYSGNTNYISNLDDLPNDEGGLTAEQLKAKFDQFGAEFKAWFNGTHIPEISKAPEIKSSTRNLATAGVQTITGLNGVPKMIRTRGAVSGTTKLSLGVWVASGQNSFLEDGTAAYWGDAGTCSFSFQDSAGNYTLGVIQNVTSSQLEIAWTKGGSGATGTATIYLEIIY